MHGEMCTKMEPLVSVIIPTYNGTDSLIYVAVRSVLSQTYKNLEVIIVVDGSKNNDTLKQIPGIVDKRLIWVVLPDSNPVALQEGIARWKAGSAYPRNKGLNIAEGKWIFPLDDDDEVVPEGIEELLRFAQNGKYDFVYGKARCTGWSSGNRVIGRWPLERGHIKHAAVLYNASKLGHMRYDSYSYRDKKVPTDWDMWSRIKKTGARIGFLDKIIVNCYDNYRWGKQEWFKKER